MTPSIEERITRLERTNRNLRWCLVAVVVAVAGVSVWREVSLPVAQAQEKKEAGTLRAKKLEIIDDDGNVLARLGWMGKAVPGGVSLRMGPQGRGAFFSASPGDGALLWLDNGEGHLSLKPTGIMLAKRTAAEVKEREEAQRQIDSVGFERLPLAESMKARSIPEKGAVDIGTNESGGGNVVIRNVLGNDAAIVQSNKANAGAVYINDLSGKPRRTFTGE